MSDNMASKRFVHHENTFGFLRLLFASLVIVSHVPEIHDGNRNREILTRIFGTLSFGELSVNAFFLISGYLITGSYLNSTTPASYVLKRVARIYPGFWIASLICWVVVTPLGGGSLDISSAAWISAGVRGLLLQAPDLGTVFSGSYYPALNGPMWTIAYEFRCYLLVLVLGLLGILRHRSMTLAIAMTLLVISSVLIVPYEPARMESALRAPALIQGVHDLKAALVGNIRTNIRLAAVFMTGASYFLYREKVPLTRRNLFFAIIALCGCLLNEHLANAGTAIFGGFVILTAARKATGGIFERINNENDISYGTYLYAWPVTKLLFWWWPQCSLVLATAVVFVFACLCGWLSWKFVEKPALVLIRKKRPLSPAGR
jgi:peptidoglycan/LPS O-acetylase OafA/YrhL